MKVTKDYELLVQDLFLRITTAPGFKPENGEIEKAFQHAARCAEVFFARWEVERQRLEGNPSGSGRTKAKAPAKQKRRQELN